jgi:hypothetical protein
MKIWKSTVNHAVPLSYTSYYAKNSAQMYQSIKINPLFFRIKIYYCGGGKFNKIPNSGDRASTVTLLPVWLKSFKIGLFEYI